MVDIISHVNLGVKCESLPYGNVAGPMHSKSRKAGPDYRLMEWLIFHEYESHELSSSMIQVGPSHPKFVLKEVELKTPSTHPEENPILFGEMDPGINFDLPFSASPLVHILHTFYLPGGTDKVAFQRLWGDYSALCLIKAELDLI
nr:hypothetical protein HmN_000485200 [Hymenolepis microstoma]